MQKTLNLVSFYLLLGVTFSLVLPLAVNSALLILFCVSCLLNFKYRLLKNYFLKEPGLWFTAGIFLVVASGIFLSENISEALAYTERKLAFLVLPLAFTFMEPLDHAKLQSVYKVYVLAVAMAACIALGIAGLSYFKTSSTEHFFYHNLSAPIRFSAIYFSLYCLFALVITSTYRLFGKATNLLSPLFILMIFLLSSKMNLFLLAGYLLFLLTRKLHLALSGKIIGSFVLLVAFAITIWFTPFIRQRFIDEFRSNPNIVTQKSYVYNTPFSGTTLRPVLWKHSLSILSENGAWLTGVGTGDFQELLNKKYEQSGMYMGNPQLGDTGYKNYNPHNQYIEILLCSGILGLVVWLLWLIVLFSRSLSSNQTAFTVLLLMVGVLCLSECLWSSNKGVVWFVFFCVLFISTCKQYHGQALKEK